MRASVRGGLGLGPCLARGLRPEPRPGGNATGEKSVKVGVSYFGVRHVRHVAEDLDRIADAGCTFVVHTFSENDLLYYRGTIDRIVELSHKRGLDVYLDPWGVGRVFGGEAFSSFLAEHPEDRQVTSDGTPVPHVCLGSTRFRDMLFSWISAAASAGAESVFWDEPHLYSVQKRGGPWACSCERCERRFAERFGHPMPRALTPEVEQFRVDSLTEFVDALAMEARSQGLGNAICLLPVDMGTESREEIEWPQQGLWERIAALGSIDLFGTDPYWFHFCRDMEPFVGEWAGRVRDLCVRHGKESQIWVQAFRVPRGRESEVRDAAFLASEMGIESLAAWGYEGCAAMSSLACDRPEVVWQILCETFRELRDGAESARDAR